MDGADLESAQGLTQEQVNQAFGTAEGSGEEQDCPDTKLPPDLEAPASWSKSPREQLDMRRQQLREQREQLHKEQDEARRQRDDN